MCRQHLPSGSPKGQREILKPGPKNKIVQTIQMFASKRKSAKKCFVVVVGGNRLSTVAVDLALFFERTLKGKQMLKFGWLYSLAMAIICLCSTMTKADDLVEQVARTGKLKTLVVALKTADLLDQLRGEGPFTIFAPTDEAFAALPEGTLSSLLLPENREKLIRILMYHVIPGRLSAMDIGNIDVPQMARTANGQRLPVGIEDGEFRVGAAKVIGRELKCSNGVIHLIDKVLLPEELRTEDSITMELKEATPTSLIDALRAVPDGRFSTFLAAVEASGGDQDWAQPQPNGNWTLFVPTDAAFNRLTEAERTTLLDPANRDTLRELLDWHALPKLQPWSFEFSDGERGAVMVSRQNDRFVLDVLANGLVFVYQLRTAGSTRESEQPFKARILAGDIQVGGNLVNIVDRVIIPKQLEGKLLASQAYRERDVQELNAGAEAQANAKLVFEEMLEKADSLEGEGQMAMYQMGLKMLEEVLPVSRRGMMLDGADMSNPAVVRAKLRGRIDDLDRVWYANFMKNSPAAQSLSAPLPEIFPNPRTQSSRPKADQTSSETKNTKPMSESAEVRPSSVQTPAAVDGVASSNRSDLSWCEVLEQKVDEAVVADPALRAAIAATGLPWRVRDKATGIEMLLVPPGQFTMGRIPGDKEADPNELPAHPVTLTKPYYLGRYEVTREQWMKVMKAEPVAPQQQGGAGLKIQAGQGAIQIVQPTFEFRDSKGNIIKAEAKAERAADGSIVLSNSADQAPRGEGGDKASPELPALASWSRCNEFCRKTGLRLPTEAEWEYACRGGVEAPRYGELDQVAWHRGNDGGTSHPVGGKAANGLGFHDMLGNAWEWVNDWYSEYTREPKTNPQGPETGTSRIIRGGYFDFEAGFCRATLRYKVDSLDFANTTGLRVAREP
jgi:uncharacterized surface protein with fasciclin (FAS1) repeats/formylglycine-generating enzyme required for sulfatase activity